MSAKTTTLNDVLAAPTLEDAKRMIAALYRAAHTDKPTLAFERKQTAPSVYVATTGAFEIREVPESKGTRYSWDVLVDGAKVGNVEVLSAAKQLCETYAIVK